MRLGSRPRSWSISPARLRPRTRTGRRATAFEPLVWLANLDYVDLSMSKTRNAKFKIGQVVRHRLFPFRGVVFDIDHEFNNTEEWYQSIPAEVARGRTSRSTICSRRTRRPNTTPMVE